MLLLSTLEVFFTWAVIALALIGFGSIVLTLFSKDCSLTDAFWMGLAFSVAALEIWSLVLPVTPSIALFLFGVGILGLVLIRSKLRASLLAAWQNSRWLLLLGLAFALLLALRSCGPFEYYDTGLYGAPSIRWIQTYPAIPGLANLHGRLGFNSSVFLCIAALDQGPWKDLGFHLFTGFLLSAFWATLLPACARVFRAAAASPADWFHTILAVPAFFWTTRSRIVGTQTDEPATIVALIAAGILFADLSHDQREDHPAPLTHRLVLGLPSDLANLHLAAHPPPPPRRRANFPRPPPASLVRSLDYPERLSSFPRHRFRFPRSVENSALRRPLVRPQRSILGTRSRLSFCRHPRLSLARPVAPSSAPQPPLVPSPAGHRARRSGQRAREPLTRRSQDSSRTSLALAPFSWTCRHSFLVRRFPGPALRSIRHLDHRRHLGRLGHRVS